MTRNDLKAAARTTLAWSLLGDLAYDEEGKKELLDLLERVYNTAMVDAITALDGRNPENTKVLLNLKIEE